MLFDAGISKLKGLTAMIGNRGNAGDAPVSSHKTNIKISAVSKPLLKLLARYKYERENILGLEISTHYIRICQMKNSYGRWSLNQLASACMENQFTNLDIQQNQDIYVENLKFLLAKHHIKTTDVALSIPTSASIIKIINMPDMEEDELAQAASMGAIWESMAQLSGSIHEYSIYYKILNRKIFQSASLAPRTAQAQITLDNFISPETNIPSFTGPEVSTNSSTEEQPNLPAPIEQQTETPAKPAPEQADTMDVLFVATRLGDALLYMDIAQRAGLTPVIMDAKCNALKHAFETNPDRNTIPHPYALLEFGIDENYIYIINGLQVAAYNINIADENKKLLTHNIENADTLQAFVQNYAGQLQSILDNYRNQYVVRSEIFLSVLTRRCMFPMLHPSH